MQDDAIDRGRIDLLDCLILVAENWKKLLIVPLLVGAAILLLFKVAGPQTYRSETVLRLDAAEVVLLQSARVLDASLIESPWLSRHDGSLTRARTELIGAMTVAKIEDAPYYRVFLRAAGPAEAHDLLNKIVAELMKQSVPTEELKAELEAELASRKKSVSTLQASLEELTEVLSERSNAAQGALTAGDIGQSISIIVSDIEKQHSKIVAIERSLSGTVSRDDIVQPPTLPDYGASPQQMAIAAFLVVIVAILIFGLALAREIFRRTSRAPENASRVRRLRAATPFATAQQAVGDKED